MKSKLLLTVSLLVLVASFGPRAQAQAPKSPRYVVVDLGPLGGDVQPIVLREQQRCRQRGGEPC